MKIQKGELSPSYIEELRRRNDGVANDLQKSGHRQVGGKGSEGEIDVSLGRRIHSELNAEQIMAERRERVEKLKDLVSSGKYQPNLLEVAEAIGRELSFEIAESSSLVRESEV